MKAQTPEQYRDAWQRHIRALVHVAADAGAWQEWKEIESRLLDLVEVATRQNFAPEQES